MKILSHHHFNGELQRSNVEHDGRDYVRVARSFDPIDGDLRQRIPALWLGTWTGKRVHLLDHARAKVLENAFVDELIRLNTPAAPGVTGAMGPQEIPGFGGVEDIPTVVKAPGEDFTTPDPHPMVPAIPEGVGPLDDQDEPF